MKKIRGWALGAALAALALAAVLVSSPSFSQPPVISYPVSGDTAQWYIIGTWYVQGGTPCDSTSWAGANPYSESHGFYLTYLAPWFRYICQENDAQKYSLLLNWAPEDTLLNFVLPDSFAVENYANSLFAGKTNFVVGRYPTVASTDVFVYGQGVLYYDMAWGYGCPGTVAFVGEEGRFHWPIRMSQPEYTMWYPGMSSSLIPLKIEVFAEADSLQYIAGI